MPLGERFKAAREQRGLTLSDVAEQIHIRSVYLAAIEAQNWKAIGAPVYTRGFLRTYARFLGLDAEESVSEFNAGLPPERAAAGAAGPAPLLGERSLGPLLWIAGAVAAALVGLVIYLFVSPPRQGGIAQNSVPPQTQATAPVSPLPATPSPASAMQLARTLSIHLTAPVWLRVVVDGNVSIEGTFPAGTTKTFHGKYALIRVGNAGGAQIVVDGKSIGRLGATGDVVEKSFAL